MRYTAWSDTMTNESKKILIYDDTCAMCALAKAQIEKRDKHGLFRLVGSHTDEGKALQKQFGINAEESAYVIEGERVYAKSAMVRHVLTQLGTGERIAARIVRLIPEKIADRIYSFVARHRAIGNQRR